MDRIEAVKRGAVEGTKFPVLADILLKAVGMSFDAEKIIGDILDEMEDKEAVRDEAALALAELELGPGGTHPVDAAACLQAIFGDAIKHKNMDISGDALIPAEDVLSERVCRALREIGAVEIRSPLATEKDSAVTQETYGFRCVGIRRGCLVFIQETGIRKGQIFKEITGPVSWAASDARKSLQALLEFFPKELRDAIRPMAITQWVQTEKGLVRKTCCDKLWLPSVEEDMGSIETAFRSRSGRRHAPDRERFLVRRGNIIVPVRADETVPLAAGFLLPLK